MRTQRIGALTRRRTLALAGAFGVAPLLAPGAQAEAVMAGAAGAILTRPIPSSGEQLPAIGLGTAYQWFSDGPAEQAALGAVVGALVAGGGSVIDTASNYGGYGLAEQMLGSVLARSGLRPRLFLATKTEAHYEFNISTVQTPLQHLGANKLDLLQVHSVDSAMQDLAAFRDWKTQGLIRYFGITTAENRYFDVIEAVMRRWKPDFIQIDYSLHNRAAERRLLPAAADLGVATMINMPFGGAEGHDTGIGHNLFSLVRGKPLPDWAREFDAMTWGQFFLKYLLGNPAVTAVIPGTNNPQHMTDNLGAGRGRLPDAGQRQLMADFIRTLA